MARLCDVPGCENKAARSIDFVQASRRPASSVPSHRIVWLCLAHQRQYDEERLDLTTLPPNPRLDSADSSEKPQNR